MRRRFIADEISADRAVLTGAHAAHLIRVLRARPGQEFDIAGQGRVRRGRITDLGDDHVVFALAEDVPESDALPASAKPPVYLWLAIFKFDRMEWAIEKATELGAARIIPLIAGRTDVHLAAASAKRVERWRRLAREASQQSRRSAEPEIATPVKLRRETLKVTGARLLLSESEERVSLRAALWTGWPAEEPGTSAEFSCLIPNAAAELSPAPIHLAIGPEGGWTDAEKELFAHCGWRAASLGPTILRAETAAVAALAILLAELSWRTA